jgi:hypothetical protein
MNVSILHRPPRPDDERPFALLPVAPGGAVGIAAQVRQRLRQRMVRECEDMVRYALGTGLVVPADVMEHLDQALSAPDGLVAVAAADRRDDAPPADAAAGSGSATETSRFVSQAVARQRFALASASVGPERAPAPSADGESRREWYQIW